MCEAPEMDDDALDSPDKRLIFARQRAGYKEAADFARKVGIKPVTYRAYESGQNGFAKLAHDFAERLSVSAKWLMTGEGDEAPPMRPETDLEASAKEMGLALVPQLELGYSMGGGSVFNDYRHTGFLPFQRDWLRGIMRGNFADLFAARGEGDSMTPTMLDGDIVLIDTSQQRIEQQDRIWALSYGELGMIKRVRRLPGGTYRILSDNPAVPPIEAADGELHIVGRVIYIGRRM
jgi:phage repressor protein C with HTH and peptisase S24 domain